jgi:hypothetical protein
LQLGVLGCKVYHIALLNTKSLVNFDGLRQLYMLDKTQDDKNKSWERCKVVDYCKEKGYDHSSNHKCLVKWNDINKTES